MKIFAKLLEKIAGFMFPTKHSRFEQFTSENKAIRSVDDLLNCLPVKLMLESLWDFLKWMSLESSWTLKT